MNLNQYQVSSSNWSRWSKPTNTLGMLRKRLGAHPGPYRVREAGRDEDGDWGSPLWKVRHSPAKVARLIAAKADVGDSYLIRCGDGAELQARVVRRMDWYRRIKLPDQAKDWHPLIRRYHQFVVAYAGKRALWLGVVACRMTRQGGSPSQHSVFHGPPAGARADDFRPLDAKGRDLDQRYGDELFAAAKAEFGDEITVIWRDGSLHEDHAHAQVNPPITKTPACMGGPG